MNKEFKSYSLLELLKNKCINIPVIQRDYAQGRESATNIRIQFLKNIKKYIDDNKELVLDFVYGYNKDNSFIPIDGQQRLTTLWLLHIYFLSGEEDRKILTNFSYKVRDSSNVFSEDLTEQYRNKGQKPSYVISNTLQAEPKADPTISSMINMLDSIHEFFKDTNYENIFERINKIKFRLIDMGEYNLGEELYIKMNARGKALSAFDNFKTWISDIPEVRKDIVSKIDNEWVPFFWNKFFDKDDKNRFDYEAFKFVHLLATFLKLLKCESMQDITDGIFLKDCYDKLDKTIYEDMFNYDNLLFADYIVKSFKENNAIFEKYNDLSNSDSSDISASNHLKIFVIFAYLYELMKTNAEYVPQLFQDWVDIFDHMLDNHINSDTTREFIFNIFCNDTMKELIKNSNNIFNYINDSTITISTLNKRFIEERIKAKLIVSDRINSNGWEAAISAVQKIEYFNGRIDFLLNYSKNETGQYNISKFEKYSEILKYIFSEKYLFFKKGSNDNLRKLQVSLLSFGSFWIRRSHWFIGDIAENTRGKSEGWYEIFNKDGEEIFKKYLDDLLELKGEISDRIDRIYRENLECCKNLHNMKNHWRDIICNYPRVLDICLKNRICIEDYDDEDFRTAHILPSLRFTKGYEVILYGFYCYLKGNGCEVTPYNATECGNKRERFKVTIDAKTFSIKSKYNDISFFYGKKIDNLEYDYSKCVKTNYRNFHNIMKGSLA